MYTNKSLQLYRLVLLVALWLSPRSTVPVLGSAVSHERQLANETTAVDKTPTTLSTNATTTVVISSVHVYPLPQFLVKLSVLDDDLDVKDLQRKLQLATSSYLELSFQEIDSLFRKENEERFDSVQITFDRFDRAFQGTESNPNLQSIPTSLILVSIQGYVTFVTDVTNQQHEVSQKEVQRIETIIQTTLRFAFEDRIDRLLPWYHDHDPLLLRVVEQVQVTVEDAPTLLEKKGTTTNKSESSFVKEQEDYLFYVAIGVAFFLTATGICVIFGACQVRTVMRESRKKKREWMVHRQKQRRGGKTDKQSQNMTNDSQSTALSEDSTSYDMVENGHIRIGLGDADTVSSFGQSLYSLSYNVGHHHVGDLEPSVPRRHDDFGSAALEDEEWAQRFTRFMNHKQRQEEEHNHRPQDPDEDSQCSSDSDPAMTLCSF